MAWSSETFQAATVTALSEDIRAVVALPAASMPTLVRNAAGVDAPSTNDADARSDDLALCVGSSGKIRIVDPHRSKILFSPKESLIGGFGGASSDGDGQVTLGVRIDLI